MNKWKRFKGGCLARQACPVGQGYAYRKLHQALSYESLCLIGGFRNGSGRQDSAFFFRRFFGGGPDDVDLSLPSFAFCGAFFFFPLRGLELTSSADCHDLGSSFRRLDDMLSLKGFCPRFRVAFEVRLGVKYLDPDIFLQRLIRTDGIQEMVCMVCIKLDMSLVLLNPYIADIWFFRPPALHNRGINQRGSAILLATNGHGHPEACIELS